MYRVVEQPTQEADLEPLNDPLRRTIGGELAVVTAEHAAATAPGVRRALTTATVPALVQAMEASVYKGSWRTAVIVGRVLVAALRAADATAETDALRRVLYRGWVEVARAALVVCPDGRLLAHARRAGEDLMRLERAAGSATGEAHARFAVGTLYVDPYTVGWPIAPGMSDDPAEIACLLERRAREQLGDELLSVPDEAWHMPPAREALRIADALFATAEPAQTGEPLARTLKARAQTLAWRAAFGDDVRTEEIVDVASRALGAETGEDPQLRAALVSFLRVYGIAPAVVEGDQLPDPAALERRYGAAGAAEVIRETVDQLRGTGRVDAAVGALADARDVIGRAPDDARAWALDARLRLEVARAGIDEPGAGDDLHDLLGHALAGYERGDLDTGRFAWSLVAIAHAAPEHEVAARGLDTLGVALHADPRLWEGHADEIRWLQRRLQHRLAVRAALSGDWNGALNAYIACTCTDAELELYELARDTLAAIADVLEHPGVVPEVEALAKLGAVAPHLEVHAGDAAAATIQQVWQTALEAHAAGDAEADAGLFLFLIQMSKGLRLGMSLTAGPPRASGTADRELLNRIAALEAEASAAAPGLVDEETLLTAYAHPGAPAASADPDVRLANLRARYDERLAARLLSRSRPVEETLLPLEDVQAALDQRTVLLITHIGSADGMHALRYVVVTRETLEAQVVHLTDVGAGPIGVSEDAGPWLWFSPESFLVQDVRRFVVAEPLGDEEVAWAAEAPLRRLQARLGDRLLARLDQLRGEGKDQLCFAAHGPLHHVPLHLAGPPGAPLADRWIVSYLPNLGLLSPSDAVPRRPRTIAALGLSYRDDPRGLPVIDPAVDEAEAVARQFGARAVCEGKVTERALRTALETARYVHVSAHGAQNAAAPAFHCVFVAPGDGGDGRVSAHEVLGLDLRGLELLTLGACETALGRFDVADNLRGLPAAFLLAGVRRMVGTLWPVSAASSQVFFEVLYGAIATDVEVLDAFREAQNATRAQFPRYRDWGAFQLIAGRPVPYEEHEP